MLVITCILWPIPYPVFFHFSFYSFFGWLLGDNSTFCKDGPVSTSFCVLLCPCGIEPAMASTDEKIAEGPSGLGSRQQIPNNLSNPENATEKPPYSIFSPAQKKAITYQTSFSAMFSGLSSFIYYPAIRPLAQKLHVSVAAINLIVSAYFIVAGIFPSVIGDIGDHSGRRIASLLAFTL